MLDVYEVYSVHQHGMAPAILHLSETHGVADARAALIKGFLWIFGNNEMSVSMLRPDLCMIVRSQARRFAQGSRAARLARAASGALTGRSAQPAGGQALVLTQEMRSYELGWLLWSFAGRDDYPELPRTRRLPTLQARSLKTQRGHPSQADAPAYAAGDTRRMPQAS